MRFRRWRAAAAALLLVVTLAASVEEAAERRYHVLLATVHELSHVKPLTAIAAELLRRGHQVTFAAPDSCLIGPNTTHCVTTMRSWVSTHLPKAAYLAAGHAMSFSEKEAELAAAAERRPITAVFKILSMMSDMNEPLLSTLLSTYAADGKADGAPSPPPLPDLMVVDTLSHGAVDAAEKLGVPVIFNNPLPLWHDLMQPQGLMVPVHAFPRPLRSLESFTGRIGNNIEHFIWFAIGLHGAWLRNRMRDRYSLKRLPYFSQLALSASPTEQNAWILQNTVFGLDVPRLMEPRVFMVGPVRMVVGEGCAAGPSARECKATLAWLNHKTRRARPLLYVNLGLQTPPPVALSQALQTALSTLLDSYPELDALWAADEETRRRLEAGPRHANMYITSMAPEAAVLSHPRALAVVSHCTFEAISHALAQALPIIGLPTRGNQAGLCTMAANAGVSRCVLASPKHPSTYLPALSAALFDVAGNASRYSAASAKIARAMELAGGAEGATDILELALHNGLSHVADHQATAHWFVGSQADVRLGFFALVLLCYCIVTMALRLARRLSRRVMRVYANAHPTANADMHARFQQQALAAAGTNGHELLNGSGGVADGSTGGPSSSPPSARRVHQD